MRRGFLPGRGRSRSRGRGGRKRVSFRGGRRGGRGGGGGGRRHSAERGGFGGSRSTSADRGGGGSSRRPSAERRGDSGGRRRSAERGGFGGGRSTSADRGAGGGSRRPSAERGGFSGGRRPSAERGGFGGGRRTSADRGGSGGSRRPSAERGGGGFGRRPSAERGGGSRGEERRGRRGDGRGSGSRGGGGEDVKGGKTVVIEPHRIEGIFIEKKGKQEQLVTINLVPGLDVYGEKRLLVETDGDNIEYRVWNPFRSKLAAGVLNGVEKIHMYRGSKVLYLGAASGTTVSHVADIVGPEGLVFAVEFSLRPGRDLVMMAEKRTNVIPILDDAKHPLNYRMLIPCMVDTIFSDVAQPDQADIVALNAQLYLKTGGHFVISIKASCIDSIAKPEAVFASEVKKLKKDRLKPIEQITLEPYARGHAMVVGVYRHRYRHRYEPPVIN